MADLILAGDVYGMDSVAADEPRDVLVLSTVHQAKGLEWSHVFIPRMIEENFPHRRALEEPGGEEEERRIFYVGDHPGHERADPQLPALPASRRPGTDRLHHTQPVPQRARRVLFERAQVEPGAGADAGNPWSSFAGPIEGLIHEGGSRDAGRLLGRHRWGGS